MPSGKDKNSKGITNYFFLYLREGQKRKVTRSDLLINMLIIDMTKHQGCLLRGEFFIWNAFSRIFVICVGLLMVNKFGFYELIAITYFC